MSKVEEYFIKVREGLEGGESVAFTKAFLLKFAESYHQRRVNQTCENDLELRKSCMDADTYHSYRRRDSFHKGWTALKEQLLKTN